MRKRTSIMEFSLILCLMLTGCGKSAETCFRQGMQKTAEGSTAEAMELLLQAVEKNPEKAEYYIEIGILQTLEGQNEAARNSFLDAVVEKELPITLKNNKNAYRGIAITYYREADYENAAIWFEQALAINQITGVESDTLRQYAKTLRMLGRYEEAIAVYATLVEQQPKEVSLYEERAELYRLTNQPIDAIRDYDEILRLEPSRYSVCFELYEAWLEQEKPETAKSTLQRILEIQEPSGLEQFYMAKAYFILGQPEAMDRLLRSAADGFLRAYFYVGELYFQKQEWQDALTYYELSKEPTEESILLKEQRMTCYRMAQCHYKLADYAQAVQLAEQAEQGAEPEQKQQLLKLKIISLEKQGAFEQAREQLLAYCTAYPEDTSAKKEQDFIELRLK